MLRQGHRRRAERGDQRQRRRGHGDLRIVETINLNIKDALSSITTQGWNDANGNAVKTEDVSATTLAVAGNTAAKAITVEGAGNLTLNVAANTKLAAVDAGNATGADPEPVRSQWRRHRRDRRQGQRRADRFAGATAKATYWSAVRATTRWWPWLQRCQADGWQGQQRPVRADRWRKEANTYNSIQDFEAGDVLELDVVAGTNVTAFNSLTAVAERHLGSRTSLMQRFSKLRLVKQIWFQFKGNAYVVVDNVETGGASADVFQNGRTP